MDVGLNPGGKILGRGGFGKGVVAGAQGGHKEIGFSGLAGEGIVDGDGLAGIIDEELFSGPVFLTKTDVELFGPIGDRVHRTGCTDTRRGWLLYIRARGVEGDSFSFPFLVKILH